MLILSPEVLFCSLMSWRSVAGGVSPPVFFFFLFCLNSNHLSSRLFSVFSSQQGELRMLDNQASKRCPEPLFIAQSVKNTAFVMALASSRALIRWPWPRSDGLSYGSIALINMHSNEEASSMIGHRAVVCCSLPMYSMCVRERRRGGGVQLD